MSPMSFGILALLLVFQVKHFVADYPWQTPWMLGKFKERGWVKPLAAHAAVHGACTAFILFWTMQLTVYEVDYGTITLLALMDFTIHFVMDRVKASPKLMGRWKALSAREYGTADEAAKLDNKYFWWALGFDQMVHHTTDILSIYFLLNAMW